MLLCSVIGGTAHAIVCWKERPWIPIAMKALSPKMHVTFGTPSISFMEEVQRKLTKSKDPVDGITFEKDGYTFSLRYIPELSWDIPFQLKLPLSERGYTFSLATGGESPKVK
jgi:hypothetical protein